jgi:hypothetical protein
MDSTASFRDVAQFVKVLDSGVMSVEARDHLKARVLDDRGIEVVPRRELFGAALEHEPAEVVVELL